MTRIDALKILRVLIDEVPEDPAWESLMDRAEVTPDETIDEFPVFPGVLDVYEALDVTPEELTVIEPHLNPLIHSQFKERWEQRQVKSNNVTEVEG